MEKGGGAQKGGDTLGFCELPLIGSPIGTGTGGTAFAGDGATFLRLASGWPGDLRQSGATFEDHQLVF